MTMLLFDPTFVNYERVLWPSNSGDLNAYPPVVLI